MTRPRTPLRPWTIVAYTACPTCRCGSLGHRADGRIVRHSVSFGSVERDVGPGSRHPEWRTTICAGSGTFERLLDATCIYLSPSAQELLREVAETGRIPPRTRKSDIAVLERHDLIRIRAMHADINQRGRKRLRR